MGYYSDVTIICEDKAYQMIMDSISNYNKTNTGYKFEPHEILHRSKTPYCDSECWILKWYSVKWYGNYEDVKSVETVLSFLRKLDFEDLKNLTLAYTDGKITQECFENALKQKHLNDDISGYRYKEILIGEDNATEEYGNEDGYFDELYVQVLVNEPDGFVNIDEKAEEEGESYEGVILDRFCDDVRSFNEVRHYNKVIAHASWKKSECNELTVRYEDESTEIITGRCLAFISECKYDCE